MNSIFFAKLAVHNLQKNAKWYVPYFLTCLFSVAMYYVISSLANSSTIKASFGGVQMQALLGFGTYVVALFVIVFLFYTNRFLMKRRTKEFGVFHILGMEKRHIVFVIAFETLYIALASLLFGILFGISLERALSYVVSLLAGGTIKMDAIELSSVRMTILLFFVIYVSIFLNSTRQIHVADPIDLLHGASFGEKEPKIKWVMTIAGIASLAGGYGIAVTVKDPLSAFLYFFLAVVLVILGTYLLFTAGSIAILKLLKKNKRYYYRTSHFINVSTMMYRMKQNAVGLANICILSTMVLVMLSTTISLYVGMDDIVSSRYPREIDITMENVTPLQKRQIQDAVQEETQKLNVQTNHVLDYEYLYFSALRKDNQFLTDTSLGNMTNLEDVVNLFFVSLADYNQNSNEQKQLESDEILLYVSQGDYENDAISVMGHTFSIRERLHEFVGNNSMSSLANTSYFIVVKDDAMIKKLYEQQKNVYGDHASEMQSFLAFDTNGNANENTQLYESLNDQIRRLNLPAYLESKTSSYASFFSLYAGFLFVGIFLSILFIMATVLILYYKQISEGYEDQNRFAIMQKVGLNRQEVHRVIRSQVWMVFFLPLVVAGIHITFAFPIIHQLLRLLYLTNTGLYIITCIICYLVFSFIYCLLYLVTSKVYYGIVK